MEKNKYSEKISNNINFQKDRKNRTRLNVNRYSPIEEEQLYDSTVLTSFDEFLFIDIDKFENVTSIRKKSMRIKIISTKTDLEKVHIYEDFFLENEYNLKKVNELKEQKQKKKSIIIISLTLLIFLF